MALLDFNLEAGMSSSLKRSVSSMENLKSLCQGGMKRVTRCYNLSQMDLSADDDQEDDPAVDPLADPDDEHFEDMMYDSGFNIESNCEASPEAGSQFPGRPSLTHAAREGSTQTPKAPTMYCKKPQTHTTSTADSSQQQTAAAKPRPALTNRLSLSVLPEYRPQTVTASPQTLGFLHAPKKDCLSPSPTPGALCSSGGLSQMFNDSVHLS
jgi:hypothetical protein